MFVNTSFPLRSFPVGALLLGSYPGYVQMEPGTPTRIHVDGGSYHGEYDPINPEYLEFEDLLNFFHVVGILD